MSVTGEFSHLCVYIHLSRAVGVYMLETYIPCYLIVGLSWVSFWINRDAAPARVLLGTSCCSLVRPTGLPVCTLVPATIASKGDHPVAVRDAHDSLLQNILAQDPDKLSRTGSYKWSKYRKFAEYSSTESC